MTAFTGDHFAFLTRFLAQSRDAVLGVTVDDGAIVWANDRAEQLLGQLYDSTIQESCRVSLASLSTLLDNPGKKTFVDITIGDGDNVGKRSVSLQGVGERMPGGDQRAALIRMEPGMEAPATIAADMTDFECWFNSIDAGVTLRDVETFAILHQNPRALQW
ncbi:MAG: PAS domain-containing protein, partial [Planctomycetaceae bacterium]|nr:PAS domain-containing protein [Planctomycetaceae bacterium]